MNLSTDHIQNEKDVRLVEYFLRPASLRSILVRDIANYDENVLWINDVPRQKGCFTQAWERDEEHEHDEWLEVQNLRKPGLPSVPAQCKDWIDNSSLRNMSDSPKLLPEITKQIENSDWHEESDQLELIAVISDN